MTEKSNEVEELLKQPRIKFNLCPKFFLLNWAFYFSLLLTAGGFYNLNSIAVFLIPLGLFVAFMVVKSWLLPFIHGHSMIIDMQEQTIQVPAGKWTAGTMQLSFASTLLAMDIPDPQVPVQKWFLSNDQFNYDIDDNILCFDQMIGVLENILTIRKTFAGKEVGPETFGANNSQPASDGMGTIEWCKEKAKPGVGASALHLAAFSGNVDSVKHYLQVAKSTGDGLIDAQDDDGCTPLHKACEEGRLEAAKLLLAAEGRLDIKDKEGDTPLHLAVFKRHSLLIPVLVNAGADVNAENKLNRTPLHTACALGDLYSVKALLECPGIKIDADGPQGETPLHYAADQGHVAIARLLVSKGGDLHKKDNSGKDALACGKPGMFEVAGKQAKTFKITASGLINCGIGIALLVAGIYFFAASDHDFKQVIGHGVFFGIPGLIMFLVGYFDFYSNE